MNNSSKIKPYEKCSKYYNCSVNNCPLHPSYPGLFIDEEDKEKKCTLRKSTRFKIGSKYPDVIKYQGLTTREWSARKTYDNLTDEEKEKMVERIKKFEFNAKNKSNQII